MFLVVWKHAIMHQNTFSTTPDAKKYLFQGHVSGGLKACEIALKHGSNHARRKTFFFSGGLEACANASKRVFNHSRR
jgi:surfactin synthase thioesterase subunit